jgi:hypothetical protein
MMLGDAPGARDFVNRLVNAAENIAIAEAGNPDAEVRTRLDQLAGKLKRDLAPEIGEVAAARIVEVFCRAIMSEKHEREALAMMGL